MKTFTKALLLAAVLSGSAFPQVQSAAVEPARGGSVLSEQSRPATNISISYVKSDRKWRFGLRSEPYNKMSEYFQNKLTEALERRGFHQVPIADGSRCCTIQVELLE